MPDFERALIVKFMKRMSHCGGSSFFDSKPDYM